MGEDTSRCGDLPRPRHVVAGQSRKKEEGEKKGEEKTEGRTMSSSSSSSFYSLTFVDPAEQGGEGKGEGEEEEKKGLGSPPFLFLAVRFPPAPVVGSVMPSRDSPSSKGKKKKKKGGRGGVEG